MADAIDELHERYRRKETYEERDLKHRFYLDEINFKSYLNEMQLEKYNKLKEESFKICFLTDVNAFRHGFLIAYRLLKEMNDGVSDTFNAFDSLFID